MTRGSGVLALRAVRSAVSIGLMVGLAAAVAVLVVGCGTSRPASALTANCANRPGPITPNALAGALRDHGFAEVGISRDCHAMAEPILYADVRSGDVLLDCAVYGPTQSWGHRLQTQGPGKASSPMWHGIKAYAFYENLECQLYPDEGQEARQMASLVASLRAVRPR